MEIKLIYSEERDTWNVFIGAEWYFEGDYEQAELVYFNCMDTESR